MGVRNIRDPIAAEIPLPEDWGSINNNLADTLASCLAPYLYEPFIDGSDRFLNHPVDGTDPFIAPPNYDPTRDIGN